MWRGQHSVVAPRAAAEVAGEAEGVGVAEEEGVSRGLWEEDRVELSRSRGRHRLSEAERCGREVCRSGRRRRRAGTRRNTSRHWERAAVRLWLPIEQRTLSGHGDGMASLVVVLLGMDAVDFKAGLSVLKGVFSRRAEGQGLCGYVREPGPPM